MSIQSCLMCERKLDHEPPSAENKNNTLFCFLLCFFLYITDHSFIFTSVIERWNGISNLDHRERTETTSDNSLPSRCWRDWMREMKRTKRMMKEKEVLAMAAIDQCAPMQHRDRQQSSKAVAICQFDLVAIQHSSLHAHARCRFWRYFANRSPSPICLLTTNILLKNK